MSGQGPYDEPSYVDWGKWLRLAVTALSALALLALLLFAASDEMASAPETSPPSASPSPTATPTATMTPASLGAAPPSATVGALARVQTVACTRVRCSEFFSRADLDVYLLSCPDDIGLSDRDADGRACWNVADW